jgi:hypothetical protein
MWSGSGDEAYVVARERKKPLWLEALLRDEFDAMKVLLLFHVKAEPPAAASWPYSGWSVWNLNVLAWAIKHSAKTKNVHLLTQLLRDPDLRVSVNESFGMSYALEGGEHCDWRCMTPLGFAVHQGSVMAVNLLLEFGADFDAEFFYRAVGRTFTARTLAAKKRFRRRGKEMEEALNQHQLRRAAVVAPIALAASAPPLHSIEKSSPF